MWTIVVPKYKTRQAEWQSWSLGGFFCSFFFFFWKEEKKKQNKMGTNCKVFSLHFELL